MKFLLTLALAGISVFALAQATSTIPVEQMAKVDFLIGAWSGNDVVNFMGQKSTNTSATVTEKVVNGRYLRSMISYDMPGMGGLMKGMHILGYDLKKKQYVGWWFDSEEHGSMDMAGDFEGDKLVMVSKPTTMMNMEVVMRTSWAKKGIDGLAFTLEMKQGESWVTVMEGDYKKAK